MPVPGQDLDFTTEGTDSDATRSSTKPRTGQSESFEIAASDDPRLATRKLPLNPSASDGSPSTRSLSYDTTAHTDTPLEISDDVKSSADTEHLPSPTLHPPGSTPDLGRIITHSPGTNSDENVQLVEQCWNPVEHSDKALESIEMARLGGGVS